MHKFILQTRKLRALNGRGTSSGATANQPLNLAPRLEQPELFFQINFWNQKTSLGKNKQQMLSRKALNGFSDWCPAYLEHFTQTLFRYDAPRRKAHRNNRFLDLFICHIREFSFRLCKFMERRRAAGTRVIS
jgi:hypothetical protein